jgi:integrase
MSALEDIEKASILWKAATKELSREHGKTAGKLWKYLRTKQAPYLSALVNRSELSVAFIESVRDAVLADCRNLSEGSIAVGILGRLADVALASGSSKIPSPQPSIPLRHVVNPFARLSMAPSMSAFRSWKNTLQSWVEAEQGGPASLESVLLSAILYGGLLHPDSVIAFLRTLLSSSGVLRPLGDCFYIPMSLPWQGEPNIENRLWYPDALTSILLTRVDTSEAQRWLDQAQQEITAASPQVDEAASLKELRQRARASSRTISKLIVTKFLEKEGRGNRRISLLSIQKSVAYCAGMELPRILVEFATRRFISHSVDVRTIERMYGLPSSANPVQESWTESGRTSRTLQLLRPRDWTASSFPVDAEPNWLRTIRRALAGAKKLSAKRAIQSLLAAGPSSGPVGFCFCRFSMSLIEARNSSGRPWGLKTIRSCVFTVARRLGCLMGEEDPAHMVSGDLEELYIRVLDDALQEGSSRSLRRNVARALSEFHAFLCREYGVSPMDREVLGIGRGPMPVDANLITLEEFERVVADLKQPGPIGQRREFGTIACLVFILAFRCGLRRQEILGLQTSDIRDFGTETWLMLRNSLLRKLKTSNAARRMPLHLLLTKAELLWLRNWIQSRLQAHHLENAPVPLFRLSASETLPEDDLVALIHRSMREQTGDERLHLHHLRHSFGTWLLLRLLHLEKTSVVIPFSKLKDTSAWLRDSLSLRDGLYGVTRVTRKHSYQTAMLLGHGSPNMTLEHYVHGLDQSLTRWLASSDSFSPSRRLLCMASGVDETTLTRWIRTGGDYAIAKRLLKHNPNSGVTTRQVRPKPVRLRRPEMPAMERAWRFLQQQQTGEEGLEASATSCGFSVTEAERILRRANQIADLKNWHRKPRHPSFRKVGASLTAACPGWPHLSADKQVLQALMPRMERACIDPEAREMCLEALAYYVANVRTDSGLIVFSSPADPDAAKCYLQLLSSLQIPRRSIRFVSYDPAPKSSIRRQWKRALGLDHRDKMTLAKQIPRDKISRSQLGMEPLMTDFIQTEGHPKNNESGANGFYFLMLMSYVAFTPDH